MRPRPYLDCIPILGIVYRILYRTIQPVLAYIVSDEKIVLIRAHVNHNCPVYVPIYNPRLPVLVEGYRLGGVPVTVKVGAVGRDRVVVACVDTKRSALKPEITPAGIDKHRVPRDIARTGVAPLHIAVGDHRAARVVEDLIT